MKKEEYEEVGNIRKKYDRKVGDGNNRGRGRVWMEKLKETE